MKRRQNSFRVTAAWLSAPWRSAPWLMGARFMGARFMGAWLMGAWLLTLSLLTMPAHAQTGSYPDRPVTIISDAAAGSTPDVDAASSPRGSASCGSSRWW